MYDIVVIVGGGRKPHPLEGNWRVVYDIVVIVGGGGRKPRPLEGNWRVVYDIVVIVGGGEKATPLGGQLAGCV